jgi:hypothetical protein
MAALGESRDLARIGAILLIIAGVVILGFRE